MRTILRLIMVSITSLGAMAQNPLDSTRRLQVFVLAGQSNMDGRADFGKISSEDLERLRKVQDRVQFACNWQPPGPLMGTKGNEGLKKRFGAETSFGPEIFFGIRVAEANPQDRFLLIKRSVGATSLHGRWNAEWDVEKAKVMNEEKASPLYPDMLAYIRSVLAGLESDRYTIRGMLWVQGETDGGVSKFGAAAARAYGENIQTFVRHVRADLGVPDLPFLMVRVSMGDVGRGMDDAASKMHNITVVPRSLDPVSPYFLEQYEVGHYNHVGMRRMGNLLADAWLSQYDRLRESPGFVAPGSDGPTRFSSGSGGSGERAWWRP